MTKESTYELQLIDCNCNDCIHLLRDNSKYKLSEIFQSGLAKNEFDRNRNTELFIGYTSKDNTVINRELKKKFMPAKPIVQFGFCKKFDLKEISFIPNTCQLDTQKCFRHRKTLTP